MPTLKTNSLAPFDASNCESRVRCTIEPRNGCKEATNLSWSDWLIRRCAKRCWSSKRALSAFAALVCCFAISDLAFAASVSSPATRASACAVRSCCFPSSLLASVSCLSKLRNCTAWRALMRVLVITTPAPNTKVRNSSSTPPISKNDFHDSSDIEHCYGASWRGHRRADHL